jgi:hypothetical protein
MFLLSLSVPLVGKQHYDSPLQRQSMAAVEAVKETIWLRGLASDLGL